MAWFVLSFSIGSRQSLRVAGDPVPPIRRHIGGSGVLEGTEVREQRHAQVTLVEGHEY